MPGTSAIVLDPVGGPAQELAEVVAEDAHHDRLALADEDLVDPLAEIRLHVAVKARVELGDRCRRAMVLS